MLKYLIALILSLTSIYSWGNCNINDDFNHLAVQTGGRVKPYLVAGDEFLKTITGKTTNNNKSASEIFCELNLYGEEKGKDIPLIVKIEHIETKKLLGMEVNEGEKEIHELLPSLELIRSEIMRIKESTSYKKDLNKLWFKISTYEKAVKGEIWMTPNAQGEFVTAKSYFDADPENFLKNLKADNDAYLNNTKNTVAIEYRFHKSHIFSYSMLIAIIGIFLTVLVKNAKFGYMMSWVLIGVEAIGITMRVIISGRAPITNMYETVLFSGFGALFIALIIYMYKRDKIFILGGLAYNILCLFMMKFADGMLSESISPLVPVLRDNFWLSTHVTTIILSYAALALSWILANMTLVKMRFGTLTAKDYRYYEELIYTAIKVGVVTLAAGIILGGVWADYSWGRFWGWDPKETWSLIVLLFYMAVLHGKSTSWINTHRFIMLSAAGFMTVMMAWFGVNYILASGLHSYGFSEGGAIFLGTFFIIQTVVIILTGFNNKTQVKSS